MKLTRPCLAALFVAAALPALAAAAEWKHPKTSWGDPDLQGMWPVVHLISVPLQRPEKYGTRLTFTDAEMAEQKKAIEARNNRYKEEDSQDRIGMGHWAEVTDLPTQTLTRRRSAERSLAAAERARQAADREDGQQLESQGVRLHRGLRHLGSLHHARHARVDVPVPVQQRHPDHAGAGIRGHQHGDDPRSAHRADR